MPKYMFIANYTTEGVKGVISSGGSARKAAVADAIGNLGGTLEGFYFGFGNGDAYVIAELPDNTTAAAISLQVGASGAASVSTVALLSPEEIDAATKVKGVYRPPGG